MRFLVLLTLILFSTGASAAGDGEYRYVQTDRPFSSPDFLMPPSDGDTVRGEFGDQAEAPQSNEENGKAEKTPFLFGEERRRKELDELYATLADAPNAVIGKRLANFIQTKWNESGSATVDNLMKGAREALMRQKNDVAFDLVSEAIVLKPDYSEAWNLRATLHFLRGDWEKSMADIQRVLELEPKHFGALTGMGAILQQSERPAAALAIYERVLEIFPTLETAKKQAEALRKKVANQTL